MEGFSKTKKGQITKDKMLQVSKELFYEQGFLNTTVAQITRESEINNGLFTYHFGTKINLANTIRTEYRLKLRNAISKRMFEEYKEYNLALGMAVEQRMNVKLNQQYPKLLRFNIETFSENSSPIDMSFTDYPDDKGKRVVNVKRDHYYQLQKRLINPNISDLDLKFYEITGIAISYSIMYAYHEKQIVCSEDYLGNKIIKTLFYLLGVDDKDYVNHILSRSAEIADILDFKLIPYFDLEY